MTPASEIIERCGGHKRIADWLGLERTAVQRWRYDPPKGSGDRIPMRHWTALIHAAAQHGVEVRLDELMTQDVAEIVDAAEAEAKSDKAA